MLKTYCLALATLVILDGVWLGLLMKGFYQQEMGTLMARSINVWAAGAFYLLYPLGVTLLALNPWPMEGLNAALRGAILGAIAYGTYNLTGAAIIKDWSTSMTFIDIAWGTCLTGAMAYLAWRFSN